VFVAVTLRSGVLNPGWSSGSFAYGFPRVVSEFFLGALIFELRLHERRVSPRLAGLVVIACFIGFLSSKSMVALANALFVVPLAILSAAGLQARGRGLALCQWLGNISYPLYIVHYPLFQLAFELGLRTVDPKRQVAAVGLLAIGLAWMLARGDRALQAWIGRRSPVTSPRVSAV
jgi:peptidoglycan/LPS O-acetylase OafA/YrhL